MNKELKYLGYTAIPSDYECQDGELAQSLNLLHEDGSIRPLLSPSVHTIFPENLTPILIHKAFGYQHYIFLHKITLDLYWIDSSEISTINSDTLNYLGNFNSRKIYDISSIGNVITIATSEGLHYIIWIPDDKEYRNLGHHLPEIDIEFALSKQISVAQENAEFSFKMEDSDKKISNAISELLSSSESGARRTIGRPQDSNTREAFQYISNAVIGGLNKFIASCTESNRFLQPFFIRYAYRLFDGSNTLLSPPVLMIPNSRGPIIKVISVGNNDGMLICKNKIEYVPADLMFRILSDNDQLSDWKEIITHIDFFVSPQIYTFDQSDDLSIVHRTVEDKTYFSHSGVFTYDYSTRAEDNNHHRQPTNTPLNPDDDRYVPGTNCETVKDTQTSSCWYIKNKTIEDLEADITASFSFYRIAQIDFEKIVKMSYFAKMNIEGKSLSTLATRYRLEDELYAHHTYVPRQLFPYNSRLSMANLSIKPFSGFPIRTMTQYSESPSDKSKLTSVSIFVHIKSTDKSKWVCHSVPTSTPTRNSADTYDSLESQFPRWLFYPDSNASEMILVTSDGYYRLPLTSHEFLTGAYWFRGFGEKVPEFTEGDTPEEISSSVSSNILFSNRICNSEINNPFLFPMKSIVSIGAGEILGISSAAKALSQGQFGQFPLYAFTDEGIWAIEVASNGTYSARQPITRDVCLNPESITQIDSAVLFATDRGIMLIAGSQVECLSGSIDSDFPFQPAELPHLSKYSDPLRNVPYILPFKDFLQTCRMAYDYINQRIYIYSPLDEYSYSYVYSMRSKTWGFLISAFRSSLNSYPEALVTTSDNTIANLSILDQSKSQEGLLITRPLKLDCPDILKTIDNVIQRGKFTKGHVQSVLYGSRDLQNWHLVWSSKDHFLRGFRGSPYKYFRIALLCNNLSPDESISGATIQFTPRLTNSPR